MYDFLNDITTSFPEYIDSVTENDMLKLIYKNEKIEKKNLVNYMKIIIF